MAHIFSFFIFALQIFFSFVDILGIILERFWQILEHIFRIFFLKDNGAYFVSDSTDCVKQSLLYKLSQIVTLSDIKQFNSAVENH